MSLTGSVPMRTMGARCIPVSYGSCCEVRFLGVFVVGSCSSPSSLCLDVRCLFAAG